MARRQFYIGSQGPFFFDDSENTPDGAYTQVAFRAIGGTIVVDGSPVESNPDPVAAIADPAVINAARPTLTSPTANETAIADEIENLVTDLGNLRSTVGAIISALRAYPVIDT